MDEAGASTLAASVDRGLQRAIGLVIVVKTGVFLAWAATAPELQIRDLAVAALIVACVAIAAVAVLRQRTDSRHLALTLVALVAAFALPRVGTPAAGAADSPIIHLVEPLLLAIALGGQRRFGVVAAITATIYVLLRGATADDPVGYLLGLQEAALILGVTCGVSIFVTILRTASTTATSEIASTRRTHLRQRRESEVEAAAWVHDDLVPTLLAISMAPELPETRTNASRTLDRLMLPSRTWLLGSPVEQLTAVAEHFSLKTEVVVRETRRHLQPPAPVVTAVVGATREALRNVARHSGQDRATLTVRHDMRGLLVIVSDPGMGFDPATAGVGIGASVIERMESVGGHARITSSPGQGTTVLLRWRPNPRRQQQALREADEHLRAAIARPAHTMAAVIGSLASGYAIAAALAATQLRPPTGSVLVAIALLAFTGWLVQQIRSAPLQPTAIVLTTVLPAAGLLVTLPAYDAAQLATLETWVVEIASLPIMVLAWVTPMRFVAAALLPPALVITWCSSQAGLPTADLSHLLGVQPLNVLFVALIAHMCRGAGRRVLEARAALLSDGSDPLRELLGPTRTQVVDLLRSHQAGTADPAHTATVAAHLAHAARDCLHLGDPALAPLRAALTALRRAGSRVELRPRALPAPDPGLVTLLEALRHAPARTVHLTTDAHSSSLVVVPPAPELAPVPGWTVTHHDEATVAEGSPDLSPVLPHHRSGDHLLEPG